jgi:hypothetical protein
LIDGSGDPAGERIGYVARVVDLAQEVVGVGPDGQRAITAAVDDRVGDRFGDGQFQIVETFVCQAGCARVVEGEMPGLDQLRGIEVKLGARRWRRGQRPVVLIEDAAGV